MSGYYVPVNGWTYGGTQKEIERSVRLQKINWKTNGRFFAGWRPEWTKFGYDPETCTHRDDRLAIAAAFRAAGHVFCVVVEHLARQPARFARMGDAREWARLKNRIRRSDHPSGDAGRAAYHRACRALWFHCFTPTRSRGMMLPKIVWE